MFFQLIYPFFVSKFVKFFSTKIIKKSNLFTIYIDIWIFKVNYARNKRSLDNFNINMFFQLIYPFFVSKFVKKISTKIIKKSNLFTIYIDIWIFQVNYARNKRSLANFNINIFFHNDLTFFISNIVKKNSPKIIKKSNLFTIYLDICIFQVNYARNKRSLDNFNIYIFFQLI